jgi:hypothetical protein
MASTKSTGNPGGAAGPRKVPEGLRVLKAQFKERIRRPGTVEADTHFANADAGDELTYVPEEIAIYWSFRGPKGLETKVVPLTSVVAFTVDL